MNAIRNDTTRPLPQRLLVTVGPRTVDHRRDVRVHLVEALRDLGELLLDGREASGHTVRAVVDGVVRGVAAAGRAARRPGAAGASPVRPTALRASGRPGGAATVLCTISRTIDSATCDRSASWRWFRPSAVMRSLIAFATADQSSDTYSSALRLRVEISASARFRGASSYRSPVAVGPFVSPIVPISALHQSFFGTHSF